MVFSLSGLKIALSGAAGKDGRSAAARRGCGGPASGRARSGCAQPRLIEGEAARAEVRREGLAFGLGGGLAGLVFGPAVEIGVAEGFGSALLLARRGVAGGAAMIVGVDVLGER